MGLATCALLAALFPFSVSAAESPSSFKTAHPMKIGIIGTGEIGGALARHWARPATNYSFPRAIRSSCRRWRRTSGPNVQGGHAA